MKIDTNNKITSKKNTASKEPIIEDQKKKKKCISPITGGGWWNKAACVSNDSIHLYTNQLAATSYSISDRTQRKRKEIKTHAWEKYLKHKTAWTSSLSVSFETNMMWLRAEHEWFFVWVVDKLQPANQIGPLAGGRQEEGCTLAVGNLHVETEVCTKLFLFPSVGCLQSYSMSHPCQRFKVRVKKNWRENRSILWALLKLTGLEELHWW